MSDYISREEAKMAVVKAISNQHSPFNAIVMLPAADVRPVVLCRDCGHWNGKNQHQSKWSRNSVAMCAWWSRNYGTIETSEGDWCSYGYRREKEQ